MRSKGVERRNMMRGVMRIKHDDRMIVFFCFFTVAPNALVKKITYSILLLVRKLLSTFTNKMFLQVKRVIGVGATGNIPCIILQAVFFLRGKVIHLQLSTPT